MGINASRLVVLAALASVALGLGATRSHADWADDQKDFYCNLASTAPSTVVTVYDTTTSMLLWQGTAANACAWLTLNVGALRAADNVCEDRHSGGCVNNDACTSAGSSGYCKEVQGNPNAGGIYIPRCVCEPGTPPTSDLFSNPILSALTLALIGGALFLRRKAAIA